MRRSDKHYALFSGSITGRRERWRIVKLILATGLALTVIPAVFFGGEYLQRYLTYLRERPPGPSESELPKEALRHMVLHTVYELPMPWRTGKLLNSGLPVYDLRVGRTNLKTLQRTAEVVLAKGVATGVQRDYVNAEFRADGDWLPVRIKLRGVTPYHYLKKRPSLRVRFPKDQYFNRKRTINLSEPYDKRLTADVTSNWELERYGILTWDSQFVIVRVNGEVLGLFQEIEQFGETIPARNRRSEGYIFSGLGQLFGNEGANFDQATHAIDLVRQCFADESGNVGQHCQDWSYASDYFDTDRWAWAAALTAVVKSRHAWAPDNLRLFWDPARGKFEPIPWDYLFFAIDPRTDVEGEADYSGYLVESFLRIPEFRRMRDRRLWFLVSERVDKMIDHADGLFDELTEALARDVRHLSFEYDIKEHREITDGLRNNKKILMELFQKHDLEARYWPAGDGVLTVELWNHGKSFLSVDTVALEVDGASTRQQLEHPVVVDGLWQGAPGRAVLSVPAPDGAKLIDLTVRDEVTSSDLSGDEIRIRQADGQAPEIPSPDVSPPLEIALKRVRVEPSRVTFGPGRVELEGVLEIPRSHEVVFAPGLDLRMGDGAGLMIYGNLSSVGTAAAPVRISGQWPGTVWGGIFVQGTRTSPSLVRVEHTIIEGGSGGENERTRFSSPFSVHDGTVVVRASEFRNSATEDGVNLKYVRTVVEENLFLGSLSDALDCDFCIGRIVGNHFVDAGGDASDFSGSDVAISGNRIEKCGDKGLSIGEQTNAAVVDNAVSDCYTGIAVKDLSSVEIRDADLARLQVGLSLYVKKPTFGPSVASAERVEMTEVVSELLHESGCALAIR
jgi:hypothetical protein